MKRAYLIGLDIGTSGAKCIIADEQGEVVASKTVEYPLYTPKPGWAEQDPADWWKAIQEGCRAVMAAPGIDGDLIRGVSLSGQMHGLVALDKDREVIRPSILWCDQRTQKQCDWITAEAGGLEGLLTYTNNAMFTAYTGGKILWLKENEPENYGKMDVFCCPKDYIRYKLTGEIAIDVSDASGTGLFYTKERRWSEGLIALAGLDRSIFPPVLESIDLAGRVTKEAALLTGLPEGLAVYAGGGDAVIQTTGSGLVKPGILGVVIGTAGNVTTGFDGFQPNPQGKLQMFCNNQPGLYHALGCTNAAGSAYRWYRDVLCQHQVREAREKGVSVYELMNRDAAASVPGSHGIVYLPYLSGERCPYPDPDCRSVFYGMNLKTTRADLTRAVMEGVTFSLKQVIDLVRLVGPAEKVYTSGGGAASPLWRQIQADVFGLPVYTMSAASEGGAYGAVLVAGVGAGVWKDLQEAVTILQVETETLPDPSTRAAYEDAFGLYDMLYPALKPVYEAGAKE
ncbi:MAG: xylulokinase [Candidatus Excrementavichristensenella sp.]|jgi:xylulokinase|nr:xylulokinase [Clostridiales bacterium]